MIYLDHAAATPLSDQALRAMSPYFSEQFFNPSAPYLPAKHVREAYEAAKNQLAHVIGAKGVDLIMTSGATESINLAFTAVDQLLSTNPANFATSTTPVAPTAPHSVDASRSRRLVHPRVLALATEHAAVLETAKTYDYGIIRVNRAGVIDLDDFRRQLAGDVCFVSISLVNNELGTIQPFADIVEIVRTERQRRLRQGNTLPLLLHSDASQALSLLEINVARLGVDLLTINAAKCGGPKGVGALYVGHGVKLNPISTGGGQERGLRSGTENVPGVIGFAIAAAEAKEHLASNRKKYQKMTQILRQSLKNLPEIPSDTSIVAQNAQKVKHKPVPEPVFLGDSRRQLASFCPVCFPGLDAERLIYKLEQQKIYVSTGAACAANKGSKSHVLAAIGLSDSEIAGSLRISLGPTNTIEQIEHAAEAIAQTVRYEYYRSGFAGNGQCSINNAQANLAGTNGRVTGTSASESLLGARGSDSSDEESVSGFASEVPDRTRRGGRHA